MEYIKSTQTNVQENFKFMWETNMMQDNNGENKINGKRDRNKQNKP
jgi:hypothetical protein